MANIDEWNRGTQKSSLVSYEVCVVKYLLYLRNPELSRIYHLDIAETSDGNFRFMWYLQSFHLSLVLECVEE